MNKQRRRFVKSRKIPTKQQTKEQIYRQVQKNVKRANARLDSLSRHTNIGTWATKNLKNRLIAQTMKAWDINKGRVKISSRMTVTQLKNLDKSIQLFLKSKTSTFSGIKSISESIKQSLIEEFSDIDSEITQEDITDIYDVMSEKEFSDIAKRIDRSNSSLILALMIETKIVGLGPQSFIDMLDSVIDVTNDLDLQDKALRLYDKLM